MVGVRRVGDDLGRWWGMSRRIYAVDLLARTTSEFARRRALNVAFDIPDDPSFIRAKARDLAGVVGVFFFLVAMAAVLFVVLFVMALGLVLGQAVLPHELIKVLPTNVAGRLFGLLLS